MCGVNDLLIGKCSYDLVWSIDVCCWLNFVMRNELGGKINEMLFFKKNFPKDVSFPWFSSCMQWDQLSQLTKRKQKLKNKQFISDQSNSQTMLTHDKHLTNKGWFIFFCLRCRATIWILFYWIRELKTWIGQGSFKFWWKNEVTFFLWISIE